MAANDDVFSLLPENLILDIFRYLTVKDLCIARRVCRCWRRIIADNTLWRHVDLTAYKLNLHRMWKIIRTHFSPVLLTLRLKGYLHPAGVNWNKASMSEAMLRDLGERCPNLDTLHLNYMNLTGVSASPLPSSLHYLALNHCNIPPGWLAGLASPDFLPRLTSVDLSWSTKTCGKDLEGLGNCRRLRSLRLNGCYRLKPNDLTQLLDCVPELRQLEIAEVEVDDLVFHKMCRSLQMLERLNLAGARKVTVGCLGSLLAIPSLRWLNLGYLNYLPPGEFANLHHLHGLQFLCLPEEAYKLVGKALHAQLPHCDIKSCQLQT